MNYRLQTKYDEMCLVVKVGVTVPCKVRIKIYDEEKPLIVFTDRFKTVKNQETFYLRLPLTSKSVILSVYDDSKGNLPKEKENNVKILSVDKTPLEKRMDVVDIRNSDVANFIEFAQRFCFNSPYLDVNKTYKSDNGALLIEYLPTIKNSQGRELTTPARTSHTNGRIQVSKKVFEGYTVPMKFAILCHEFSHFYLNEDMHNETEADINGLLIYLGLGYPRIEAYEAFYKVFDSAPSEQNGKRFKIVDNFIRNFEKNKMVLQ